MGSLSYLHIVLLLSCTSKASSVLSGQLVHLVKLNLRLIFHNTELTDPVIFVDFGITQRIRRHIPPVVRTGICLIYDSHMVCLDDTEIFVRRTARHDVCLISLRQLHSHTEWNQAELIFFQNNILCRTQVDPV